MGVKEGRSTKMFLEVCDKNNGSLISVDILDCSKVSNNPRWRFIHSSDDNFDYINKNLDLIDTKKYKWASITILFLFFIS